MLLLLSVIKSGWVRACEFACPRAAPVAVPAGDCADSKRVCYARANRCTRIFIISSRAHAYELLPARLSRRVSLGFARLMPSSPCPAGGSLSAVYLCPRMDIKIIIRMLWLAHRVRVTRTGAAASVAFELVGVVNLRAASVHAYARY